MRYFFFQEFDEWLLYACCCYIIVSLISIGMLFNQSPWFPFLEMTRCLVFLGYQLHFSNFLEESFGVRFLLYGIRVFYFYSALKYKIECVHQIRGLLKKEKVN